MLSVSIFYWLLNKNKSIQFWQLTVPGIYHAEELPARSNTGGTFSWRCPKVHRFPPGHQVVSPVRHRRLLQLREGLRPVIAPSQFQSQLAPVWRCCLGCPDYAQIISFLLRQWKHGEFGVSLSVGIPGLVLWCLCPLSCPLNLSLAG